MKDIVVDASMLAAVAFKEPDWESLLETFDGRRLHAPTLLPYELANIAWKKVQRQPDARLGIVTALGSVLDRRSGITLHQVPATDAVLIAQALRVSAYDASYLWLAGWLGADLATLDRRLAEASALVLKL